MASLAELYQAMGNPNARNFLNIIAKAEGVQHGYNTLFGNQRFNSLNAHPNIKKSFRQTDGKVNYTTAAGRYQFLNSTWNNLAKQYGFRSFSPQEQDLGALALIAQRGALQDVLSGNYVGAIQKLGKVWASLPSSTYAQPKKTYAQLGLTGQTVQQRTPQRTQQQRQNDLMLVGVMGDYRIKDTGIGTGDHYDLRLARNADGSRGDVNPYLNRFVVNGKPLNSYRQTGKYMEQRKGYRHGGVDYGINGSFGGNANARNLYIAPEWANRVKNVRAFDDNKNGGGWVTQVEFDDGKKINILHQNQKGTQQVMSAYQGRQPQQQMTSRFLSPSQIAQVLPQLAQQNIQPKNTLFFGDSIAHGYRTANKASGTTKVGANPSQVLAQLQSTLATNPNAFKGQNVVLSSGLSNGDDVASIEKQLQLLKNAGANVSLLGVSNSFNVGGRTGDKMNAHLANIAKNYGANFRGGFIAGADNVHPKTYAGFAMPTQNTSQQQRFLSAEQARRVLPQLSAPQQPRRFLSQDEISKVLPQLARK